MTDADQSPTLKMLASLRSVLDRHQIGMSDRLRRNAHGTGENWLLSRHFDLKTSYSEPAEKALADAAALVERDLNEPGSATQDEFLRHDQILRDTLSDTDPHWVAWHRIGERHGWLK